MFLRKPASELLEVEQSEAIATTTKIRKIRSSKKCPTKWCLGRKDWKESNRAKRSLLSKQLGTWRRRPSLPIHWASIHCLLCAVATKANLFFHSSRHSADVRFRSFKICTKWCLGNEKTASLFVVIFNYGKCNVFVAPKWFSKTCAGNM